MPDQVFLTVTYTGEPDEPFELHEQHQTLTFGRDEAHCDIVIWSAINGVELSRVAGQIWRMGDELWLRNLSTTHDLHLDIPGQPSTEPLPPRGVCGGDPGWARSIPGPLAYIRAPGGCELEVRQQRSAGSLPDPTMGGADAVHAPDVPDHLRPVAAALCEPLLRGGRLPATYSEIDRRLGIGSQKRTRNLVGELRELYVAEIPQLSEKVRERKRREEGELTVSGGSTMRHGIWVFESADDRPTGEPDTPRRSAMALPDYYEVAYLLVRRRLVSAGDVDRLPDPRRQDGGRP